MAWFGEYISLSIVSLPEASLRIFLAILFGMLLGWEREVKNKPIEFRAYIIVAVTTCVVAMLGQELYSDFSHADSVVKVDLAKIIAGVLTGIGFLGAGAVIQKDSDRVVGTATGASIWAAGGLGLTLGFGLYGLAVLAFIVVTATLVVGGWIISLGDGKDDKMDTDGD